MDEGAHTQFRSSSLFMKGLILSRGVAALWLKRSFSVHGVAV